MMMIPVLSVLVGSVSQGPLLQRPGATAKWSLRPSAAMARRWNLWTSSCTLGWPFLVLTCFNILWTHIYQRKWDIETLKPKWGSTSENGGSTMKNRNSIMIYTRNNGYGWTTSSILYNTMIDRLNSRSIFWSLFKFNLGKVEILKAHPNWCSKNCSTYAPISRRCDEDVALAAVTSDFTAFQHVPLALKANRLIALAAVKQSARIFKSLPEDVKADREARKHGMEDGWWSWLGSYDIIWSPLFSVILIIVYHLLKIIREYFFGKRSFWHLFTRLMLPYCLGFDHTPVLKIPVSSMR